MEARTTLMRPTPRQSQVYELVCQGKSNIEIANILGIRLQTVKNHVQALARRVSVPCRRPVSGYRNLENIAREVLTYAGPADSVANCTIPITVLQRLESAISAIR